MMLEDMNYFKISCGVNSEIQFIYEQNCFILLQQNIIGKFELSNELLTLIFPDGTKDIFKLNHNHTDVINMIGDAEIGGQNAVCLYKRPKKQLNIDYKPKNIGLVIGTYGSVGHIHLQLENAKKNFPNIQILIIDDGSNKKNILKNLCQQYNVQFLSNNINYGHMIGDVKVVYDGLKWAKENNISYIYKLSRRFIPIVNLEKITNDIIKSEFATYSNVCDWGIRSECMLLHTDLWYTHCLNALEDFIKYSAKDGLPHPVPEVLYTRLCKRFYYALSAINNKILDDMLYTDYIKKGLIFGILPFLNNNRGEKSDNYLWHSCNTPMNYLSYSRYFGLNSYEISDFQCELPGME